MKRFGFTLIEVNLAMFIMAMGTLGLVGLYAFGYRENQQSNEDVQGAAMAEMHLNAMIAALSSTNMTWDAWRSIGTQPAEGWGRYAGDGTGTGISAYSGQANGTPLNRSACNSTAKAVYDAVMNAAGFTGAGFDPGEMTVGIVVAPSADRRTYSVAVRCGRRAATLVHQPLYYTEVYFQGLRDR
ncbi:MAG: prepilin-type N-terminal cleavage/methylation domain-containing protein [Kiritimatiellae bacterium]|nr:prepilin-type N-terminal cleavage/methylation domain-containing protein [Kiritimatiellia bacterium]